MATQESFFHPGTVLPRPPAGGDRNGDRARGLPYMPHSETSKRAAREFEGKAPTIREAVLAALREAGERGLTDEEIFGKVGKIFPNVKESTVRCRRVELTRGGFVMDSGRKAPLASGLEGHLWRMK